MWIASHNAASRLLENPPLDQVKEAWVEKPKENYSFRYKRGAEEKKIILIRVSRKRKVKVYGILTRLTFL